MTAFRHVRDVVAFDAARMRKNSLFVSERCFCDVYAFEPGQTQKGHRHAESDKVYFVLEGEGDFRVDGETQRLSEGCAVFCVAGAEHEVVNSGSGRLTLLVFMAPPPQPK